MEREFCFTDILGNDNKVRFTVIKTDADFRCYGIRAEQFDDSGRKTDIAVAAERFITEAEAEQTLHMLCDNTVMPCTLCDII